MNTTAANAAQAGARSVSERIAAHIAGLDYDALPAAVVERAKALMLDTLAVAWAGRDAPGAPEAHGLLAADGGKAESTVWGYGGRLPASSAAFLNSLFGAALDYDAVNTVHADVCVLPAALAIAERQRVDGKAFLAAYVAGADLAARLGGALTGRHKGWFTTSIYGVFGAAAACARLLGLDAAATAHAFGIALSQASGTQQANIEQALTKRLQSAFAARAGAFSALLAGRGVSAPREAFEGRFGLFQLYQEGDPGKVFEGLGERFALAQTNFKKYPICACSHAALDAAFSLIREYGLTAGDVTAVEVIHSPLMHRLVGAPFDPSSNPQVAAQFSVRYALASALLRGHVDLDDIQEDAVLDPAVRAFTQRIDVTVDEANTSSRAPATVVMQTRHGRLSRTASAFPWSAEAPPTPDELARKADACFGYGPAPLAPGARKILIDRVRGIEAVDDMSRFFADVL
ncbi:MmgE/PrpD family protein [Pigmentiphaga soli]|uniref:MmgE/PrpD family protein n=1 Tax=Pigmentiphaga soli TaxID=1007095 RepID=A0ABP8GE45_9BURK